MAKGIYIGNSSIARKVKGLYIGVDGVARKVKKGYIGVGGVARQFYSSETLIPFTSNPAPIAWTPTNSYPISIALKARGTNEYGTWTISADSKYGTTDDYTIDKAFDGATTKYWSSDYKDAAVESYIQLDLPTGVTIKPITVYAKYSRIAGGTIQGFNPTTNSWENLISLTKSSTAIENTDELTTEVYYSKFRIHGYRYSSTYKQLYVYELQIQSGTLKIE